MDVSKIDVQKVTSNGYYFDADLYQIRKLSRQEVLDLRRCYHDSSIAREVYRESKYKFSRYNKYDQRFVKLDEKKIVKATVVVAGICIAISSTFLLGKQEITEEPQPVVVQDYTSLAEPLLVGQEVTAMMKADPNFYQKQIELTRKYCNIYHVNFDMVYSKLFEITSHFSSEEYQNLIIPGVSCKGMEVCPKSEEEMILYYVRHVSQAPEDFGFDETVYDLNNTYQSGYNYQEMIGSLSHLLGEDPCLIYAMVQMETSFSSNLFLEKHNPSGLRTASGWLEFPTLEAGLIETILQVRKYRDLGANSIEEIAAIHAPEEDGNENWIPLTTSIYNELKIREEEIFGSVEKGLVY